MPDSATATNSVVRLGNIAVLLSLAASLAMEFGGVGLLGAYLAVYLLASRLGSIWDSVVRFNRAYRQSDAGKTYTTFVIFFAANVLVTFTHRDYLGGIETSAKQIIIAYTIFFHVRKYNLIFIFSGAAIGAVLGGLVATYDVYYAGLLRAGGILHPNQFGMLACLLSAISFTGFLFFQLSKKFKVLMLAGTICGIVGTVLSGSRGAAVAVPLMLLLLLGRLWRRSKPVAAAAALISMLVALAVAAFDPGMLRARTADALEDVSALWQREQPKSESGRDRVYLLEMSLELFREQPLIGVGNKGWDEAIEAHVSEKGSNQAISGHFNQAHNQLSNYLAKGGLLLGIAGLAHVFIPLFLFCRSARDENDSLAAFVGLVTCVGFASFSLTESVMVLSLPSCVYAILVCYLMAAKSSSQNC